MKVAAGMLGLAVLMGCDAGEPAPTTVCGAVGISVTPSSARLAPGDTLRLRSGPLTDYCTKQGPFAGFWHSSNATIASVDSASGLVTARSPGMATIIISAIPNANISAAMVVEVGP